MIIHTRIKYFISLIILLILLILSPAISLADADRIFKENSKAVVVVIAYDEKGNAISQGSGFIVRADGAVVTNYHVISKARDIKVKAGDKVLDVEGLLFTDKENDLVILKAKAKNMPVVKLGDIEETTMLLETVYVISSHEGLENTISNQILTDSEAIPGRRIFDIFATNSPVSSGDPVFNRNGEVIGVATVFKEAQYFKFVMPVDLIKDKIIGKKVTAIKEAGLEDFEKTAGYWMVFYSLGMSYASLDMYKEAMEAYKQVIRIKPDYAKAHFYLGPTYPPSGKHNEAIEAYKQAIRINPDDASAHHCLGLAYSGLDMYKEAKEAHKQAVRIKPESAWFHQSLGIAYGNLGKYNEAIEAYKQAIRINPNDSLNHSFLGDNYGVLGMYKEAMEAYKQAIRIKPDYVEAHYGLGVVYFLLNNRGSALEQYKILKSLDSEKANKLFNRIYE